jgi:hypothetical protein
MADMRKWAAIEAVPSSALSWPEDAVKRWQDHQEAMWEKRRQKRDVEASVT